MLSRLSIRDIVLIDKLDIDFAAGLAVLTGETGAGKSILLDSFALALGGRGDQSLVRQGADQGQVTAVFEVRRSHPARAILDDAQHRRARGAQPGRAVLFNSSRKVRHSEPPSQELSGQNMLRRA